MKEKLKIIKELFASVIKNKKWWLIPLLIVLLVVGIIIVIATATGLAPIIYPFI